MRTLVVLLVLGSLAHADDRHTVVVLGIVAKEPALLKAADAVTRELRVRAAKIDYTVKGTAKDIDAAMLASDCDSLQPGCAARLGAKLGADYVIAGTLERRGAHNELVLIVVDVERKQRLGSVHQSTSATADPKKLARTAYTRLSGGDLGDLAISANASTGDVLIDGQVVAGLFEGKTTLTGLLKGSHLLAIHAKGYKPLEVDVTIEAQTKQMLLLDPE
jgi:hypothetical protein